MKPTASPRKPAKRRWLKKPGSLAPLRRELKLVLKLAILLTSSGFIWLSWCQHDFGCQDFLIRWCAP